MVISVERVTTLPSLSVAPLSGSHCGQTRFPHSGAPTFAGKEVQIARSRPIKQANKNGLISVISPFASDF